MFFLDTKVKIIGCSDLQTRTFLFGETLKTEIYVNAKIYLYILRKLYLDYVFMKLALGPRCNQFYNIKMLHFEFQKYCHKAFPDPFHRITFQIFKNV